jgi:hypothetical protein
MSPRWLLPQPPASSTREGRLRLIGEAAQALIAGKLPRPEARLFLAGALLAWLRHGGRLERDYFQVIKRHSKLTPNVLWDRIISDDDAQPETGGESGDDQRTKDEAE